ncbi:MAG TPA: trypsin-like peptidase domain-containing protein [Gemmatimonadales bacterium]|nr:trypsin-like peptidase domain-containing protein [Gemmatimonadales bacterium]
MNWLKFGGLVALAFALGLLFAGLLDLPTRSLAQEQGRATPMITPVKAPSIPEAKPLIELSDAFAAVADAVRPSVVYIRSERTEKVAQRPQLPPGFERFFPRGRDQQPQFEEGSGSGFVISNDGYVLTNNHVVAGATKVIVRLLDRRQFTAKVVGADPNTDVAVLKIDASDLHPIALGNSDTTRIGEWVLAIGNPLGEGLNFTVTQGIVSAKGRDLRGLNRSRLSISDFIQTDAAINPGNSGGPLVNMRGEVIGINSAIASETGFYSGYGFAIPINLARTVANQLIATGKVHRAALGIEIRDADVNDAAYVGLKEPTGVLVVNFSNDQSAARKAGIEPGDVIVAVDGQPVEYVGQLQQRIAFRKPGETVQITVARKGGTRKTLDVKLQPQGEVADVASADQPEADSTSAKGGSSAMGTLGVSVQTVTPAIAQQLGMQDTRGVLVTDVTPGGPAWERLAEPGQGYADVITAIEGTPVRNEAELRAALRSFKPGSIVTLRVVSPAPNGTTQRIVRVRLGGS